MGTYTQNCLFKKKIFQRWQFAMKYNAPTFRLLFPVELTKKHAYFFAQAWRQFAACNAHNAIQGDRSECNEGGR